MRKESFLISSSFWWSQVFPDLWENNSDLCLSLHCPLFSVCFYKSSPLEEHQSLDSDHPLPNLGWLNHKMLDYVCKDPVSRWSRILRFQGRWILERTLFNTQHTPTSEAEEDNILSGHERGEKWKFCCCEREGWPDLEGTSCLWLPPLAWLYFYLTVSSLF